MTNWLKYLVVRYHRRYGTLATGGSDGTVAVWDHRAKKRIKLYNRLPTAISALAFSGDGSRLAIGVSSMQDVTSDARREELKQRGDDPNHVSIVVKTIGEELKVRLKYPNLDPCGCTGVCARPERLLFWPTFGFVTLYAASIMSLPDLINLSQYLADLLPYLKHVQRKGTP